MRAHLTKTAILAALAAGLAACAGGGAAYPSLAMRPFETGDAPAAPLPAPPANRPVISAQQLAGIRADASAANTAFLAAEDRVVRLARAAAGQPVESQARAAAIVALADLDAERARTALALASLDALAAEAAGALSPDPALATAQTEIAATLARQDSAIARLWEAMGS
jgi:hypothetical protein